MDLALVHQLLLTVLKEQDERFAERVEVIAGLKNDSAACTAPSPETTTPQFADIDRFVPDVNDPNHFEDWLKRFEIAVQCAKHVVQAKDFRSSHEAFNGRI